MNTELIYKYCNVIADYTNSKNGNRAIYYREGNSGVVETNICDEGEYLCFMCNSLDEFREICEDFEIF